MSSVDAAAHEAVAVTPAHSIGGDHGARRPPRMPGSRLPEHPPKGSESNRYLRRDNVGGSAGQLCSRRRSIETKLCVKLTLQRFNPPLRYLRSNLHQRKKIMSKHWKTTVLSVALLAFAGAASAAGDKALDWPASGSAATGTPAKTTTEKHTTRKHTTKKHTSKKHAAPKAAPAKSPSADAAPSQGKDSAMPSE
jgi:hypothetical protein